MLNFVALDFETASRARNNACSIAVVRVEQGVVVRETTTLLRPPHGIEFDPRCIEVHGIYPQDVADAPTFDVIWPSLYAEYMQGVPIVAHNARFDIDVLRGMLDTYHLDWPMQKYACTVKLARKVWPDLPNHKLNTVGDYLSLSFQHHQALDDARTCANVVLAAARATDATSLDDLLERTGVSYEYLITDTTQVQTSFF